MCTCRWRVGASVDTYQAEADLIHDSLLTFLKGQLTEIMSVPNPLVTCPDHCYTDVHVHPVQGWPLMQSI